MVNKKARKDILFGLVLLIGLYLASLSPHS